MSHDQPNPSEADTERFRVVLGLLEIHGAPTWAKLRSGLGEDPHPAIRSFNTFYDDKELSIKQNKDTYPITFHLAGSGTPEQRYEQARQWLGPNQAKIDEILAWDDYRKRYAFEMWRALREGPDPISLLFHFLDDGWTMDEVTQAMEDADDVAVQGIETLVDGHPMFNDFIVAMRRDDDPPPLPKLK